MTKKTTIIVVSILLVYFVFISGCASPDPDAKAYINIQGYSHKYDEQLNKAHKELESGNVNWNNLFTDNVTDNGDEDK
jgi:hypothetical protein